MEKREILEKAQTGGEDEREKYVGVKASSLGGVVVTIVIGFFIVINSIKGQNSSDLFAILLAYWSAQYFYQYKQMERKTFLVLGCVTTVGFILATASYFIWG